MLPVSGETGEPIVFAADCAASAARSVSSASRASAAAASVASWWAASSIAERVRSGAGPEEEAQDERHGHDHAAR